MTNAVSAAELPFLVCFYCVILILAVSITIVNGRNYDNLKKKPGEVEVSFFVKFIARETEARRCPGGLQVRKAGKAAAESGREPGTPTPWCWQEMFPMHKYRGRAARRIFSRWSFPNRSATLEAQRAKCWQQTVRFPRSSLVAYSPVELQLRTPFVSRGKKLAGGNSA